MIVKGYVTPHPPIILPEVGRGEEQKIKDTINSMEKMAREISELEPETIIISSPHAPDFSDGFYLSYGDVIEGNLKNFGFESVEEKANLDKEVIEKIQELNNGLNLYCSKDTFNQIDHGTLIPLRFINKHYKDFKLVIVGISGLSGYEHSYFGELLKDSVNILNRKTVFIASGDLSHVLKKDGPYGYRKEGPIFDKEIIEILSNGKFHKLFNISHQLTNNAAQCGLKSFQILAGAFNGQNPVGKLYSYEGPFGVGYGVLSFTPEKSEDEYVNLARKAIEEFTKTKTLINLPEESSRELKETKGATFVTIYKNGKLRGCIGTIEPITDSIGNEIIRNAISSATNDPRFPVVKKDELEDLDISVDVLKKPEKINSIDDLNIKKYGVIVSSGYKRGVLLPNIDGIEDEEHQVLIALSKAGIDKNEKYFLERFEVIRHE